MEDDRFQRGRGRKGPSPALDLGEKYGGRGRKLTQLESRPSNNSSQR